MATASGRQGAIAVRFEAQSDWSELGPSVGIGWWGEVAEFVGVGDGVHGLDQVVGDIEGHNQHGMAVRVQVQRSRLPIDLGVVDAARPEPLPGPDLAEHAGDPLAPIERAKEGHRGSLAAAVGVDDHVGGEESDQSLSVVGLDGVEETLRELLAFAA